MANAQHDEPTRPQGRKGSKLGIASFSLVVAVVGAFYLGSQHNASPIGNAPQSAVTNATPANVSQSADDANAPMSQAGAPFDTGSLTILSDRDGSPIKVVIPTEPAGDFGAPDYSSDLDPDVGLYGYESGINAIRSLAASTAAGETVANAFRSVMTDGGGIRDGADAGYTDSGAILLAVWYQRTHPGVSFAEAAKALTQTLPDVRMIKKAAHVARGWVEAFNNGDYSYEYKMSADDASTGNTPQNTMTNGTTAPASQANSPVPNRNDDAQPQADTLGHGMFANSESVTARQAARDTGNAATAIRAFYEALGDGRGGAASQMIIPEKRHLTAFSPAGLTSFYGNLKQPIRLIDIAKTNAGGFLVHYRYATNSRVCDGRALVTTVVRGGRNFIRGINALNEC